MVIQLTEKNGIKVGKLTRYEGSNGYLKHTIQYRFNVEQTMFTKVLRRVFYDSSGKNVIKENF